MKFAENSTQSAEYLRQAIPLMVKYNIPPNPLNYALWYTYVSNRLPILNQQLDQTLETYGTCPTLLSEQLFREYVIGDELGGDDDIQAKLVAVMSDLHEQTDDAIKHTSNYSLALEGSLDALNDPDPDQPLEAIIQRLTENTVSISQSTMQFQQQITEARAEIANLKDELQKTRLDARIDPLTGLFNRRVLDTELQQILGAPNPPLTSLIMVDIDHFKQFNDEYGHLMGDKVLQYLGRLLKEECQEPTLPVRFGGEEFVVLLIGQSTDTALQLAENLRQKIHAIRIKQKKTGKVISSISASFGVVQLAVEDTAERLLGRADQALYQAKDQGRNRVVSL